MTLLEVSGLCKRFGGTEALRSVDFRVDPGEVHALLGENGAGKSTLIKILAGIHAPDTGTVIGPRGPSAPGRAVPGIAFVHQDLGLVDTLSVAENVALGAGFSGMGSGRAGPLIDWKRTRESARNALAAMDLAIGTDVPVGRLGSAEKSMVAIARALVTDARILILDEPTASLPEADVRRLHAALGRLRERGLGVVYVTHRLDEVFRIADRVTVLRDGAVCHAGSVSDTSQADLVNAILGRRIETMYPARAAADDRPLMVVQDLRSRHAGPVSFTLHAGEVLGLVGLRRSGQDTVGRMLCGALPSRGGRVTLEGTPLDLRGTRRTIGRGLGFVSSKRVEESLCQSLSLRENLFMDPSLAGIRVINGSVERSLAAVTLSRFGVIPAAPERLISTLSGGNQQKVVLARWLATDRKVLILEEPTTGVDIGARAEIYRLLREAVDGGVGVVLVSSDFDEVAGLCDRAVVFDRGKPVATLRAGELTLDRLTRVAGGGEGVSRRGRVA